MPLAKIGSGMKRGRATRALTFARCPTDGEHPGVSNSVAVVGTTRPGDYKNRGYMLYRRPRTDPILRSHDRQRLPRRRTRTRFEGMDEVALACRSMVPLSENGRRRLARIICVTALGLLAGMVGLRLVSAADLIIPAPAGRFLATCEVLGRSCYADACGRDQIDAAARCRAQCPGSVVLSVVPAACSLSGARVRLGVAVQASPVETGPLPLSTRAAVELALSRRTAALTTVAQTLRYAERASNGAFAVERVHAEHRPDEPYARVHICYRLGDRSVPPICNLDYLVTRDPPHVEPADRFNGIGRDFEQGPRAFVRALAREAEQQQQPVPLQALRRILDPYNPYDWR